MPIYGIEVGDKKSLLIHSMYMRLQRRLLKLKRISRWPKEDKRFMRILKEGAWSSKLAIMSFLKSRHLRASLHLEIRKE